MPQAPNWGQKDFQFTQRRTVVRPQFGQTTVIMLFPPQSLPGLTEKRQALERVRSTSPPNSPYPYNSVNLDFICIRPSCLSAHLNPINSSILIGFCKIFKINLTSK